MKAISLCSGADGFGLAAQLLGIEVVAHVEIETKFDEHYKRHWPNAQRFYDLTTVDPEAIADAEIIFGGEPCQGNSVAGKREGKADHRYLWPYYFNIGKVKRPVKKESHIMWQNELPEGEGMSEQAILVETYNDMVQIIQDEQIINLNYESIDSFCKLLKKVKRERK